jgi:hypothetical protein
VTQQFGKPSLAPSPHYSLSSSLPPRLASPRLRSNKGKSTLIKKEGERSKNPVSSFPLVTLSPSDLTLSLSQLRGVSNKGDASPSRPSHISNERFPIPSLLLDLLIALSLSAPPSPPLRSCIPALESVPVPKLQNHRQAQRGNLALMNLETSFRN